MGVCCPLHPSEPFVLLCSSLPFFLRTWTYDHPPTPSPSSHHLPSSPPSSLTSLSSRSLDLEDLASATQYRIRSTPRSLPLLLELSLYRDGGFLTAEEVDAELIAFAQHFPLQHQFVLKINGGLIERKSDMDTLNDAVQRIVALTLPRPSPTSSSSSSSSSSRSALPPRPVSAIPPALLQRLVNLPIIVDLTFDRLIDLSLLPSSVLLRATVLPCVRYFLSSSSSNAPFIAELSSLVNALHTIDDISLLLILTVDEPAPDDLHAVLDFLQAQHRIVRMVVVTRERSPSMIFDSLLAGKRADAGAAQSTDVYALLQAIEHATHERVHPVDFVPFRVLSLLSPLLPRFGLGVFHPDASPMCLLATVLVNTPTLRSIPLSHLFDLHRLYHSLLPLSSKLARGESLGVLQAKGVQRLLKQALIARIDCPDVLDYLTSTDPMKQLRMKAFMRQLQVLVVHNKMDLASVDIHRRCECSVVQKSPMTDGEWIASCTGCV